MAYILLRHRRKTDELLDLLHVMRVAYHANERGLNQFKKRLRQEN